MGGCASSYDVLAVASHLRLRPPSTRGSNESNCGLMIRSRLSSVKIFAL